MDATRRCMIRAGASLVALAALPAWPSMPLLRESDPDAAALEYTADADRLNPARQPLFSPGNRCAGCYFYQGRKSSGYAPCTVFAGWRVSARGWCREFRPRAG